MEYPLDISVLEKCDEEGYDAEVRLIQQAFDYKTKGVYPSLATKKKNRNAASEGKRKRF